MHASGIGTTSNKMKVLFVASGNKAVGSVSAFVQSQFDSLRQLGLDMIMYPVVGHGWRSYLRAGREVRRIVRAEGVDIVHAHYSICGLVASLACLCTKTKVVVSILGSFPRQNFKWRWVRFFIKHVWDETLVKSQRTADQLGLDLPVIPNGVNLEQFKLIDFEEARRICGFEDGKKYVIWCSNPDRPEKRFWLAQQAVEALHDDNVALFPVFNKSHDDVVKYMCAADVLLLTSVSEGSPNVIKEAMACNCPVVSTDVGDVRIRLADDKYSFVSEDDSPECLSECLQRALYGRFRTGGRELLLRDGLTTESVAHRIIEQIYCFED